MFKRVQAFIQKPRQTDILLANAIDNLQSQINNLNIHLIALARLGLITPAKLLQEVNNIQANTEFITSLTKAKENHVSTK